MRSTVRIGIAQYLKNRAKEQIARCHRWQQTHIQTNNRFCSFYKGRNFFWRLDTCCNIVQCFAVVFINCLLYRVDCYWEGAFCRWDYHPTLHDRVLYPRSTKRTPTHLLRLHPLCSGRCGWIVPVFRFYHIGFSLCTEKTKTNCKVCLKHFTCMRGFV